MLRKRMNQHKSNHLLRGANLSESARSGSLIVMETMAVLRKTDLLRNSIALSLKTGAAESA